MVAIGSLYYLDMTNKKLQKSEEKWIFFFYFFLFIFFFGLDFNSDFNSDEAIKYYSFHAYIKQKFHIVAASLTV